MVEYSYVVTHDPAGSPTTISDDIQEMEIVDVGTGEVKSGKITLDAKFGKFLTAAPILAQFDLIQITLTDEDSNTYDQFYEVNRIIPIKNAGEGYAVEVELLGQEHWLMDLSAPKEHFFTSATTASKDIGDFYNDVNGSSQPEVQNHDTFTAGNNELPQWTANNYLFGVGDDHLYDNLMQIIEGLGASVANAGAGDFFELYFDSNIADSTKINFEAFSSGGDPDHPTAGSEVTITDTNAVNEAPTEGGIDAFTGSLIKAWGRKGIGTLPQSVQDFNGQLEAFLLDPQWISGVVYPTSLK